jgi:hypothetical protein
VEPAVNVECTADVSVRSGIEGSGIDPDGVGTVMLLQVSSGVPKPAPGVPATLVYNAKFSKPCEFATGTRICVSVPVVVTVN